MNNLQLSFNVKFEELYDRSGLIKLDAIFVSWLADLNPELHNRLMVARATPNLPALEYSHLIVDTAPYLEDFIAELFSIQDKVKLQSIAHNKLYVLYQCKRLFVQRRALKSLNENDIEPISDIEACMAEYLGNDFSEYDYSVKVMEWLEQKDENKLAIAARYAAWAVYSPQSRHKQGILFKQPHKIDPQNLIALDTIVVNGIKVIKLPNEKLKPRSDFNLTDCGASLEQALDQAHYCIFCHNQNKDSCSKGMREKDGNFKKNFFNTDLTGCPLEEKISEMNSLKASGHLIGALAAAVIDNPLLAATGHRICNDCMKSCIYQKQEPVNIPQIETKTLRDVLSLPWGFEIYSLLTRWNPLNLSRPIPKADSNYKVLIAGMGPAGFNLAHHLLNEGHIIVGIEGLKIEPLSPELSGVNIDGSRVPFKPIYDIDELYEPLDQRTLAGFGGVAEYGITVRWDKNFLKIIRLLLERRKNFALYGGVRFGSTITYDTAFELGFNHIALAMGAGKPTLLEIENPLVSGVRTASDFLMALQLTGAAKKNSIANLQIRLPIIVIGGGLTAIDTATESVMYYQRQVEKFLTRYESLAAKYGEEYVRKEWNEQETIIAEEFLSHAKLLRNETSSLNKLQLIKNWGGVKVVYRRNINDAPSYRLNHEEVELAFKEGIEFIENLTPIKVEIDQFQHAAGLLVNDNENHSYVLPAKTILIAAGTSPNTVIVREDVKNFHLDGKYFQAIDEDGNLVTPERIAKPNRSAVLMNIDEHKRAVSFFGDLHPSYNGNVVKAMASAKQGYPTISKILNLLKPSKEDAKDFFARLNPLLIATITEVIQLTSNIIEIKIKAPLAALSFKPGQFYRLQNYEKFALKTNDTTLLMEGIAVTGASVDKENGILSTIVLEMGGSSSLCRYLKNGEPVVLMGATGTPTDIHSNENVLLLGGGLGNAVLFSIGRAFRSQNSKVLYFAAYRNSSDIYKQEEIELAADHVIWCIENGSFTPSRANDQFFQGNIIQALEAYAKGNIATSPLPLNNIDRLIAIGSDKMMQAVNIARNGKLKHYFKPNITALASINSPMQCMMKEICAQCLQKHVDPLTGKEFYIYSCYNQDQSMDSVDFNHLDQRLKQNSLQEKLTKLWIKDCIENC